MQGICNFNTNLNTPKHSFSYRPAV